MEKAETCPECKKPFLPKDSKEEKCAWSDVILALRTPIIATPERKKKP
jgi:hypothetical protein